MPVENLLTALVTALLGLGVGWAAAALVPVFPPLPDDDDAGTTEPATKTAAAQGTATAEATAADDAIAATNGPTDRMTATGEVDEGATAMGGATERVAAADEANGTAPDGTGEKAAGGAGAGEGEDQGPETPPTQCPRCGAELSVRELARVAVRARCGSCGAGLRERTGLIAGTGAVLLGLVGLTFGPHPLLPAYLFLGAVCLVLGFIDLRVKRLPNVFTLPAYPIALVLLAAAAPLVDGGWGLLLDAVVGMAALWAVFFVLWFIYPAGMGFGDVKLSGLLGLYLGWFGAGIVFMGAFAGFLLAGAYGLVLVLAGKANRKTAIPFGPFMMLGALLVVLAPVLAVLLAR